MHHVEAGRVHEHNRHTNPRLQVAPVRSRRYHHVRTGIACVLDLLHRVLVAQRYDAQIRNPVVLRSYVAIQVAQLADADCPDAWRWIHDLSLNEGLRSLTPFLQSAISLMKSRGAVKKV